MKYRSDIVIILDILDAIGEEGALISHIATYANMPNPRVKEKLDVMIENGLVTEEIDKSGRRIYRLTDKGLETREKLRETVYMLKQLGLIPRDSYKP